MDNNSNNKESVTLYIVLSAIAAVVTVLGIAWQYGGLEANLKAAVPSKHVEAPRPVTQPSGEPVAFVAKPATLVLTSEKTSAARKALQMGDYATASKLANEILASSKIDMSGFHPFNKFMEEVVPGGDAKIGATLDAWIAKDKNAAMPHLLRARYLKDAAWRIRGEAFASTISDTHLEAFREGLLQALSECNEAIRLDAANPYAYYLRLDILAGYGNSKDMEVAFQASIKKFPEYYQLYRQRLRVLAPKWGGSVESMQKFVAFYADTAPEGSPRKLLYLKLYADLMDVASIRCRSAISFSDCFNEQVAYYHTPEIEAGMWHAFKLYDAANPQPFLSAIDDIFLNIAGGGQAADEVLNKAETQLAKLQPRPYILDRAAAHFAYAQKDYSKAETKYRAMLDDIERTTFVDEQDKYMALGDAYSSLASIYNKVGNYELRITYENATVAARGGIPDTCHPLYKLKRYDEAIKSCTLLIENGGDFQTRLWRAKAYEESGQIELALAGLREVADSEDHQYRAYAADGVIGILLDQHKFEEALAFMAAHPYLFDENEVTDKHDIASNYNNRCYSAMELKRYEEALKDCNKSLTYYTLPETVKKKRQLDKLVNNGGFMKRLTSW